MTSYSQRSERVRGFTLIELMVVVTIIAILSAAVVPSFSVTLARQRQNDAAMQIASAVFKARARAARTGRCHRVRVYTGATSAVALDEAVTPLSCLSLQAAGATVVCGTLPPNEANVNDCSQARTINNWHRVSYASVGASSDPIFGDAHVKLIGDDVEFDGPYAPPSVDATCSTAAGGNPNLMLFENTGFLSQPQERYYEVALEMGGTKSKPRRFVRVSPGGAVKYTLCE